MKITAIILTSNEKIHLSRCVENLNDLDLDILIVDSFSTDNSLEIAQPGRVRVLKNKWINYSTQFNWALKQVDPNTDWVLRIDADEILTAALKKEITEKLPLLKADINGIFVPRRMMFQGRPVQYGGLFPTKVLRIFRYGKGECENRWMDEHIKVTGHTVNFKGDLIDNNLKSLTWWINKHNQYSSREAVDLLNLKYRFMKIDTIAQLKFGSHAGLKRWIKETVYFYLPTYYRSFIYFLCRYIFRLGFLDSHSGANFHFLQGFWYRYLVDAKVKEVESYMKLNGKDIKTAIKNVLEINI